MNSIAFFKLIRWKNLLLILYVQLLLKLLVFPSLLISTNLSIIQFIILSCSVILIAAAGYIINDIFDLETDLINKSHKVIITKKIAKEKGKQLYLILNTIGLILGIGLSLNLERPSYSFIFIGTSLLLYYYSKKFKALPLIGNTIVSFLVALSILIVYLIDIDKSIQTSTQKLAIHVILGLSLFSFILNMARELIKDIEDVKGDYILNMNTLPILIGKRRTQKIASFICVLSIGFVLFTIISIASIYKFTAIYLLIFIVLPLTYITINLRSVNSTKGLNKISILLKVIMFLGVNSVILFSLHI